VSRSKRRGETGRSTRSAVFDALCAALYYSGLLWLGLKVRGALLGGGRTRILCYHRVADDDWPDTLMRDRFVAHLTYLRRRYRLVDVGTVVDCLRAGRPLPRDTIALTFDDGHRDLLGILPDLQSHGAPAAFFVLTSGLPESGTSFFDRIRGTPFEASRDALAALPEQARIAKLGTTPPAEGAPLLMSAADLRLLREGGFEVGSHTRSHPLLPALPSGAVADEIAGSRQDLETAVGSPVRFFAYPWGKHDGPNREAVRSAGYAAAFATGDRSVDERSDVLAIPRVHIGGNASVARLAAEASGLVELLRRVV